MKFQTCHKLFCGYSIELKQDKHFMERFIIFMFTLHFYGYV